MPVTLPTRARLHGLIGALIAALAAIAVVVSSAAPSSAAGYSYYRQIGGVNIYACEAGSTSVRVMAEAKVNHPGFSFAVEGRTSSMGYYSSSAGVPFTFDSRTYLTVSTRSSDSFIMVRIHDWDGPNSAGFSDAYPLYKSAIPNC